MADFDLFVIGGGSGGVATARRAAAYGAKVGLCENRRLGGTCVLRGCIPKKLMRYGAIFGEALSAAPSYGWSTQRLEHDWHQLVQARNREIDRLNGIYIGMLDKAGVTVFDAKGRLAGPGRVEVNGKIMSADRILIAVGAKPHLLDIPGIEHAITSDDLLEGETPRPNRLAVMGAGYIGVELASICHGLGIETTLIYRRELPLTGFDHDLREALAQQMEKRGLKLQSGTTIEAILPKDDGIELQTNNGALEADTVLFATGREARPQTEGLGLDTLDVKLTDKGAIEVNERFETSAPGLYAVGDCSDHAGTHLDPGMFDLTPIAIAEGRVIAETLFNDNPHQVRYDAVPTAVFGVPEAASVGLTEEEAKVKGHDVAIFRSSFRPMVHTLTGEEVRSMMKLVVDRSSDRVLGCHMVGDDAGEIIQGLAVALNAGATKAMFDQTVALHPSAAEEFVLMYQPVA